MKILNPLGYPRAARDGKALTLSSVRGIRLGILSNHWKSMDRIAERIVQQAPSLHGIGEMRLYDVPINGPMSPGVEQRVLAECDAALVGLAN